MEACLQCPPLTCRNPGGTTHYLLLLHNNFIAFGFTRIILPHVLLLSRRVVSDGKSTLL